MAEPRRAPSNESIDISGARALIVEARFYDDIQDELLEGAVAELKAAGVTHEVITVPGALEIPAAIAIASMRARAKANRSTWWSRWVVSSGVKPSILKSYRWNPRAA